MEVYGSLPNHDLAQVPAHVTRYEAAGYDGVTVAENAHNAFLPLGIAAINSSQLSLATGVAIVFPRSPMVTAQLAYDIHAASGGRFVLGMGSQVKPHIERRFSTEWTAPAPRMREYIAAVRAIWNTWSTGDRLDFAGDHYQFSLMTPNFSPKPLGSVPRVKISAVGPAMLRLAGEACDGVSLHGFCTPAYIANQILPRLEEGMARTGRQRQDFQISGGGFIATGETDEEVAQVAEWARYRVGFYGSTRAYWPVLAEHGLEDLGSQLNHLSRNNGWDQMAALVDDDVLRLFCAIGRHDQIEGVIREHFGGLTDVVSASVAGQLTPPLPTDLVQDLQRIPTQFEGWEND